MIKIWFFINIWNELLKFQSLIITCFLNSIWTKGYYTIIFLYINSFKQNIVESFKKKKITYSYRYKSLTYVKKFILIKDYIVYEF